MKKYWYATMLIFLSYFSYSQSVYSVPVNDSPCIDSVNPPYDLGTNGQHSGTTCGATGFNDNPGEDMQNRECGFVSDDNAVWYRVTYDPAFDGISINIEGGTIGEEVAVEVFAGGENAICDSTAVFRKAKCDGLPVTDMHIGCLEEGDYVWIKVTSSDGDCGTFNISVEGLNDCNMADTCDDITESQTMNPVTPKEVEVNYECINGCLDMACPDTGLPGGCIGFNTQPTVWFRVYTDVDALQLYTSVTTNGSWTPVWSVFYAPDGVCTDLVNAAGTGSFPCSLDAQPPAPPLVTGVTEGIYYIAVSANTGDVIDDPDFEICVATLGFNEKSFCVRDKNVSYEVISREHVEAERGGPPYQGPFCPGEEIKVRLRFVYNATETGDDWFMGFIPKFGSGWDMSGYDFDENVPTATPMGAGEWFEDSTGCAPMVTEDFSYLCTYRDTEGHLKLCNTLYEDCPCSGGMLAYDTLPSGYFWVQEGGSPDCDPNHCSPSRKYGVGSPISEIEWIINLRVKEFSNRQDYLDNDDLSISFTAFSDGAAGCWDDPITDCLINKPHMSPRWHVNYYEWDTIVADPGYQEICSGSTTDFEVYSSNGVESVIRVVPEDNPNVFGEKEHVFYAGHGIVNDALKILFQDSCELEQVVYYVQAVASDSFCYKTFDTIIVDIYPAMIYNISATDESFYNTNDGEAIAQVQCGQPPFSYLWSTGDTTARIDSLMPGIYYITINDASVCSIIDSVVIEPYRCKEILYSTYDIQCFGNCDGKIELTEVVKGIKPYYYSWNTGDTTATIDSLCAGIYYVTVTDSTGCSVEDSIEVLSAPEIVLELETETINTSCYGYCDGAIELLDVKNIQAPFTIKWSNGSTNNLIAGLCAGNYYLTITDLSGCEYNDTFEVIQPPEIHIDIDTVINISDQGKGAIFVTVENSNTKIFEWSGPGDFISDKEDVFHLDQIGCYTLTVTDTITKCNIDTTICIKDVTGVFDMGNTNEVKLYPNPATNSVMLEFLNNGFGKNKISIINTEGQLQDVKIQEKSEKLFQLDLRNMVSGIYFLKIEAEMKIIVKKLVILGN